MRKAHWCLAAISGITLVVGSLAFKIQRKFLGFYFCASTYNGQWFNTRYTTINPTVTLYCTLVANAAKTRTFKVGVGS